MTLLHDNVVAAKQRLIDSRRELHERHSAGCPGVELCAAVTEVRDAVIRDLFEAVLADLDRIDTADLLARVALVALGGYGRRDVAPFSDVDLMLLHDPSVADRVGPLAKRLVRDVFDAGLILGHSVCTPEQACRLARGDYTICTSLMESRFLLGDRDLFERFLRRFRKEVRKNWRGLAAEICQGRAEERARYGETVFLLEPNIKRSRGALRDLHLIRWLSFTRYGTADPAELQAESAISEEDVSTVRRASEFLLRLRNELQFHAGSASDVLSRSEQFRVAAAGPYEFSDGLLPVERFMQDYFRHTDGVSHVAAQLETKVLAHDRLSRLATSVFGHRVDSGLRVGLGGVTASRKSLEEMRGDLTPVMRLVDLANMYDMPIDPATWEQIRRQSRDLPPLPSPGACGHFLSLLEHSARLGPSLRSLHEAGILERFIPEFARARGLLQFNQYHKYTVDEHCIRAVECAVEFASDPGPVGRVYRGLSRKRVLHLALLIHDLGKGHLEDHREVGVRIAAATAARLGLDPYESELLIFLVGKHMLMNYLAFRRDIGDERMVLNFAVQVGSPEVLEMLYVLTATDLAAVGPDVWDGWKAEILTDLFDRAMQHLDVDSPAVAAEEQLVRRRESVRQCLGADAQRPWLARQLEALPGGYLNTTAPEQAAADLRMLESLEAGGISAAGQYQADTNSVQFTVCTSERVSPGIFHKLTGALSSCGLEIRSAQINTLADGLVLDRFLTHDPDFAGRPPRERIEEVNEALVDSLRRTGAQPPTFRRTWHAGGPSTAAISPMQTRVNVDNHTSDKYTIIDIFTHDRAGLLYAITRCLFELGLSVFRAKIGTYLDQVVDVFYVTDSQGAKIQEEGRLATIRERLLEVMAEKNTC
jgi:[protein-PII] uridylyltransferase